MSDDVKALITEARRRVANADIEAAFLIMTKLADALEAATAEMHARELHHFETEKLLVEAGIDPDAQSAPLVVESREALGRAIFPNSWDSPDEQVRQDFRREGLQLADEIIASGVVRLAADVVREAKAEAWDEGFSAGWAECSDPGPFVNDVWDAKPRNPYRTEGENQ